MARRLTAEEFIEKAREVHGDAYSYDLSTFSGTKRKMRITCPEHGDFWQTPGSHIHQGNGCPRHRGGDFYARAAEVHGDRYTYGEYVNSTTKVEIICPEHGAFYQLPHSHLGGAGCARCRGNGKLTTEDFIERARGAHGDTYDYSRSEYTTSKKKLTIVCRIHGEFEQVAGEHLRGSGCPRCAGKDKDSRTVVEEFLEAHGDLYDYSRVVYTGAFSDVTIVCREHGEFNQTPSNHRAGSGCPECSASSRTITLEWCMETATKIHGDRYSYDVSDFSLMKNETTILCPEHGEFNMSWSRHINQRAGCPTCNSTVSKPHQMVIDMVANLVGEDNVIVNDRNTLSGYELDVLVPSRNLAIEVDGLYWHSAQHKTDRNYHQIKQDLSRQAGVKLIQFWDQEIIQTPEIVSSMIANSLGMTPNKVYARRCDLVELSPREYREFLGKNHLQGAINSGRRYGLALEGELVSVMGVSTRRGRLTIDRFASKINTVVVGGFSRLLARLKGAEVYTHSANRYASGEVYQAHGFSMETEHPYTLYYTDGTRLYSRNRYQKHKLKDMKGYSDDKTADEILRESGIHPIYAAGTKTWRISL